MIHIEQEGVTLRDYFAAAALQGFLIRGVSLDKVDEMIGAAYEIADAMLKQREEHENEI